MKSTAEYLAILQNRFGKNTRTVLKLMNKTADCALNRRQATRNKRRKYWNNRLTKAKAQLSTAISRESR